MLKDIGKINLFDINILILIISIFAFKDYPMFGYISSFISFLFLILPILKYKKISNHIILFFVLKAIFILFCLSSIIWALNKDIVLGIVFRLLHRLIISLTIILYVDSKDKLKKVIYYMIIASFILCIRMIFEVPFSAWGVERVGNYLNHDIENTYGNTGITYVLGICGIYLLAVPKCILKGSKLRYFFVIIFSLFSLLSGSRKQVLFLVISLPLIYFFKSKDRKQMFKNIGISLFLVILIMFIILKVDVLYNAIGRRMLQFLSYFIGGLGVDVDSSTLSRLNFLNDSWKVFVNNPILGIGIGGYQYVNSTEFVWAENTFLELLANVGVIGFFLYYVIHFIIIKSLFKRFRNRNEFDIQMYVLTACLLIVDLTMVSYYHVILQFYLGLLYSENYVILKERNVLNEKK